MASILGAPVSGFILDHAHWAGLSSWQWLLFLEALPAIVCGVLTCFLLPCRPAEARFLAKDEKSWLIAELAREEHTKTAGHSISALRALAHPRVWHLAAVLFGFDIGLYAMSFYMPQVVKAHSNGFSNTVVGILVMVPHLAGFALVLLGRTNSQTLSVLLWSLVAMGIYSFFGPFFSIPSNFLAGFSAAAGIALINSVGNLGGFFGPSVIGAIAQGPPGIYGGLAVAGAALIFSAVLVFLLPSGRARPSPAPLKTIPAPLQGSVQ